MSISGSVLIEADYNNGVPRMLDVDVQRMLLLHGSDFAALRRELLASLGEEAVRGVLTRLGNSWVRKMWP